MRKNRQKIILRIIHVHYFSLVVTEKAVDWQNKPNRLVCDGSWLTNSEFHNIPIESVTLLLTTGVSGTFVGGRMVFVPRGRIRKRSSGVQVAQRVAPLRHPHDELPLRDRLGRERGEEFRREGLEFDDLRQRFDFAAGEGGESTTAPPFASSSASEWIVGQRRAKLAFRECDDIGYALIP